MKRIVTLLLCACLLCAALPSAIADEPLMGGWTSNPEDPTVIPEEVLSAFQKATEGFTGNVLVPVAYLASQVVAGMNYCLLCSSTLVIPNAVPTYALVYIYADLEGGATILRIQNLEYSAEEIIAE